MRIHVHDKMKNEGFQSEINDKQLSYFQPIELTISIA